MRRLTFKCVFKTDVVLNATTATEGNQTSLDYIPGANFLGIVAKKYSHFAEKGGAYDIFHSGKVRFGDAHVAVDGLRSFKAPLVWFRPKGEKKLIKPLPLSLHYPRNNAIVIGKKGYN